MKAGMRPWAGGGAILLFFAAIAGFESTRGDENKPPLPLPAVLSKVAPENVEDLRALEKHVQKVLERVLPSVVGVRVGAGQGSGVIVSEDGLILTAGHVSGSANLKAVIHLPDGKELKGKTLGRRRDIDSGMMKITTEGKYPFLEMGKSSELKKGQWVIAVGHPGGFRANRTPVVRLGRILFVNGSLIRTDCSLVGGDSGGPLFDMQGRVIGIHSRIGPGEITENIHVPIDTFRDTWDRLAKGEVWGGQIGASIVQSAGGKIVFEKKDTIARTDPFDALREGCFHKVYPFKMDAGSTYTIDLVGGDKFGKKYDPYLRLESPEGTDLAQDDDSGGYPHSRIVHRPTKTGTYRILVTSCEPKQTGTFTLTIREAEAFTGKVEVLRAIKLPAPAIPKVAEGLAKAKVKLHLSARVYDLKGKPLTSREVTFEWDQGKETVKSDGEGIVRWPLVKEHSKKLVMLLPRDSRASLNLSDQNGNDLSALFDDVDRAAETIKSAGGKIVKTFGGILSKKDLFDEDRKQCYRQTHEFKMQAGKTYTIDLVSEDFDAYLRLEHTEKGKLKEDDDGGGLMNARIVHTADKEGDYRIVVTTCDPVQTGSYVLVIREIEAKK
jgi:S1-C subfamily serine protease